jgi:hypothetical protein
MSLFFSNKAVRLLLSLSVSIWMAGGCLFGCSSTMGAEVESSTAAVDSQNCHAKRTHDCCATATAKPKKRITKTLKRLADVPSFMPVPRGTMKDCPLVTNSTAATSKSGMHLPQPARGRVAALPTFERQAAYSDIPLDVLFLPNRGPTHLRCCVFLI